jgi:hypothetical protein
LPCNSHFEIHKVTIFYEEKVLDAQMFWYIAGYQVETRSELVLNTESLSSKVGLPDFSFYNIPKRGKN